AQVHARLFASGVFQCVLEIPAPGKAERELILAAVARRNATRADTHDVNFSVLSYLTEGYMPADLHGLYERAVHEATMRVLEHSTAASEGDVVVKHADLVRAHAGFKPVSLRGVQLQSSQTRWADIGGLEDTRRQLRETLELPTRLDKSFLCGMPNTEDRRDILARQATKVNVSGEVDWLRIAQRTDGLTGADLQALLYNAFLEAVHEATASHQAASDNSDSDQKRAEFTVLPGLDQPLSAAERARLAERLLCMLGGTEAAAGAVGTEQAAATAPVVTAMHFERALQITQSSLSAQDRAKFEAIFRDFVDDKKGPRKPVEQRATLA
ncbi:Peroxisome biosynthesis protein pex1, partial [Coemansia biformis]